MGRMENANVRMIKYSIMVSIGIFVTPYLVMIVGLIILFAGVLSTSPTLNLLGFRSNKILRENEINLNKIEDPDRIYYISWKKVAPKIVSGIFLCALSLVILSLGWRGIIFYL